MRYIEKKQNLGWFEFIDKFGQRLKSKKWSELHKVTSLSDGNRIKVGTIAKVALHESLWLEQRGLCVYCTQAIPENVIASKSHLEHIKPKSIFNELRFDYRNIAVSCNGFDCSTEVNDDEKEYCGHYKDSGRIEGESFDEIKFVSPIDYIDIESYFDYGIDGVILCSEEGKEFDVGRIEYMIRHLGLNSEFLKDFRRRSYESLIQVETDEGFEFVEAMINDQTTPILSFHPMIKKLFGVI